MIRRTKVERWHVINVRARNDVLHILYGFMYKDGFYSTATSAGLRGKKWLSMVIRHESEDSARKVEKLRAPVNMKNRNIVDYFGLSHTVSTALVRIPCSTHSRWNRLFTELSFLPPARADQADPTSALRTEHPHSICHLLNILTPRRQLTGSGRFSV